MTPNDPLNSWIEQATAGLPESASRKFRTEIADHFAEARKKHVEAGMSPDEAERAAFAALGHADEVGRRLRDGHFSRRVYTRGAELALVVLVVSVLDLVLAQQPLGSIQGQAINTEPWPWVWKALAALIRVVLGLMLARGLLTFLDEQYEVRFPRWAWRLCMACVLVAAPILVLSPLQVWASYYSPLAPQLSDPATLDRVVAVSRVLGPAYRAGALILGGLLIGLCVLGARALRAARRPILAALVIAGGLIALGQTGGTALNVVIEYVLPHSTVYPAWFIAGFTAFKTAYSILMMALLAGLLGLFFYMRRPGALLAG